MILVRVEAGKNISNATAGNMNLENFSNLFKKKSSPDKTPDKTDEILNSFNSRIFKVSLLSNKERNKISKLINAGQEVDLEKVKSLIGRERAKEIHWQSIDISDDERDKSREERRRELISLGKDKEPLILEDGSVNLVDVHGIRPDNQEDINENLPEGLERNLIEVAYGEKTSSDKRDETEEESDSEKIRMVDASGKINSDFLKTTLSQNEKSSFIMTGGNLRGCLLESLGGIIAEARKIPSSKVDFHVPYDKCYDDNVYEKITKFSNLPEAIMKTVADNSEIYENGELTGAIGSKDDINSKFRFYFWDKAEEMTSIMGSQYEKTQEEKSKPTFEDLSKELREQDEKELSEIRKSINEEGGQGSETERSFDTSKKTPENFSKAARTLLNALKAQEESAEKGYVFSYDPIIEKTSQGKEIKVDCLSWIGDEGFATDNKRRLVLVATNPIDGKIVGLRLSDIKPDGLARDEKGNYTNKEAITGEILTRLRGEGIAPALDNAFSKTVTKIANYYQQEYGGEYQFNWVVENANLKRLNQKKEEGLSGAELEELETEQKRWQSVYGENGKMGFNKIDEYRYEKIVQPDPKEGENYEMPRVGMDKYRSIQAALEECIETKE